jgi:NADPH2:quinone reductase
MQAAILEEYGAPFRIATISRPQPGPGQVLVRIAASSVNPLDVKIHGGAAAHARHPLPAILGIDLAGTIEAVGEGVTRFRGGEEVFGMTGGVGAHQGSLAEFSAADADLVALKPANLSMREAAALPLVFVTAWEGLIDRAHLQAEATRLAEAGKLVPLIDPRRFSLASACDAYAALKGRTARGKIVVELADLHRSDELLKEAPAEALSAHGVQRVLPYQAD